MNIIAALITHSRNNNNIWKEMLRVERIEPKINKKTRGEWKERKRNNKMRCQSYHVNTWNEKKMFISECRSLSKCFSMVWNDFYGCYFDYISSRTQQSQDKRGKCKKKIQEAMFVRQEITKYFHYFCSEKR